MIYIGVKSKQIQVINTRQLVQISPNFLGNHERIVKSSVDHR